MPKSQYQLLLTTDGGLEKVVAEEITEKAANFNFNLISPIIKPFGLMGQVLLKTSYPVESLWPLIEQLHTIHHVIDLLATFPVSINQTLSSIEEKLKYLSIDALHHGQTFRITTKRSGHHAFTSMDVERTAGAVIGPMYNKKVSLENFDCNIRIDVIDSFCLTGIQLSTEALSHRYHRSYLPRVSIKPTVAYALLHLADLKNNNSRVLDPFCGAGTILFEAVTQMPHLKIFGSDVSESAVKGTLENAWEAGLAGKFHIRRGDARKLNHVYPTLKFEAIIANPPYGLKLEKNKNFNRFYGQFLKAAYSSLSHQGKLVIMVWKYKIFEKSLRENPLFKKIDVLKVARSHIYLSIYVLQAIPRDDF